MKALAIDTSVSRFSVAAKNDDKNVSATYDVGMKQSEFLLPAIDYVLEKMSLKTSDLDYCTICAGPGSFTGLRLAYSVCKALTLSNGMPLYPIHSLEAYAHFCRKTPFFVVPAIDAKKDRFFSAVYLQEKIFLPEGDYELAEIFAALKNASKEMATSQAATTNVMICAPEANLFFNRLDNEIAEKNMFNFSVLNSQIVTEALFEIAEAQIEMGVLPAEDYEAPLYIRPSEVHLPAGTSAK